MPSSQSILWSVLPQGREPGATDTLLFSIYVAPQLSNTGKLGDYAQWLDWPATVQALKFNIHIGGLTIASDDKRLKRTALDADASGYWKALFDANTPVTGHSYDNPTQYKLISYAVANVAAALKGIYGATGALTLGKGVSPVVLSDEKVFGQLDITAPARLAQIKPVTTAILNGQKVAPASMTTSVNFAMARAYLTPLTATGAKLPNNITQDIPDFHQMLSGVQQYPGLCTKLGLVLDFKLTIPNLLLDKTSSVWVEVVGADFAKNVSARTQILANFQAAARNDSKRAGVLRRLRGQFTLAPVDVDGASVKTTSFAAALREAIATGNNASTTPSALRSTGITLAEDGRAEILTDRFKDQQKLTQAGEPILYAEDIERGFRVDVRELVNGKKGAWYSLCGRDETLTFERNNTKLTLPEQEGILTVAISQNPGDTTTEARLHEAIFRWTGWSLAVQPPNAGTDAVAGGITGGLPLHGDFALSKKFPLLPLRFGHTYQFRLRPVDLAGNGPELATAPDDENGLTEPADGYYARSEPVSSPNLNPLWDLKELPGESAECLVLRSNFNKNAVTWSVEFRNANSSKSSSGQRASQNDKMRMGGFDPARYQGINGRIISPPAVDPDFAEAHGVFDNADGKPDGVIHDAVLKNHMGKPPEGPLAKAPAVVAYLPDPFATGATLMPLAQLIDSTDLNLTPAVIPYTNPGDAWQDARPFQLTLTDGDKVQTKWDSAARVLTLALPKAETLYLRLSSTPPDAPAATDPAAVAAKSAAAAAPAPAQPMNATKSEGKIGFGDNVVARKTFSEGATAVRTSTASAAAKMDLATGLPMAPEPSWLQLWRKLTAPGIGSTALDLLTVWRWIDSGLDTPEAKALLKMAAAKTGQPVATKAVINLASRLGLNEMLTPGRVLTFVHAVQQPLVEPAFKTLTPRRTKKGQTKAEVFFEVVSDAKSSSKLDFEAEWTDPVDDPTDLSGPRWSGGKAADAKKAQAFSVPFNLITPLHANAAGKTIIPLIDLSRYDAAKGLGSALSALYDVKNGTTFYPTLSSADAERLNKDAPDGLKAGDVRQCIPQTHEFGDTKYHSVAYTAVATTRYRDYFPEILTKDPANLTRRSAPKRVDILNTAPPCSARVPYVIPTFGWSQSVANGRITSKRAGRGLRIYLERPWFNTGDGEMLAVVLSPADGTGDAPDNSHYVTQWGADPIWDVRNVSGFPQRSDFPLAVLAPGAQPSGNSPAPGPSSGGGGTTAYSTAAMAGTNATLGGLNAVNAGVTGGTGQPKNYGMYQAYETKNIPLLENTDMRVDVAPHAVAYDAERGLWYADIEMQTASYFPFVKLCVARYQPNSVEGCYLSTITQVEFIQLTPDRAVTLTQESDTKIGVVITGVAPTQNSATIDFGNAAPVEGPRLAPRNTFSARVETHAGAGTDAFAWYPARATVDTISTQKGTTLWSGRITLPGSMSAKPYRVVVTEEESFITKDANGGQPAEFDTRLVFADVIELKKSSSSPVKDEPRVK